MTYFRCIDCEQEKRGIEHRELVNDRCKPHALAAVDHLFVEVAYISNLSGIEYRVRGFLFYYATGQKFSIKKFARHTDDSGVHTPTMEAWQLRAIRPITGREQACSLPPEEPVFIHHFGRQYGGRVIERSRSRVLVRFRGTASGRIYDRWKPAEAVQHRQLPSTSTNNEQTT